MERALYFEIYKESDYVISECLGVICESLE